MATNRSVGAVVDPPTVAAAPFGLVNSLTLQSVEDRWEGGVGFESRVCAAQVEIMGLCDDEPTLITDGSGTDRRVYAPAFGITAIDTCTSTFGSDFRARASARAEALLDAATQKALERELMWGHIAAESDPAGRWLTGPMTEVVEPDGTCSLGAVSLLEEAYAACGIGSQGVLHMSRGAAAALDPGLVVDGDVLRTKMGTPVIVGSGYAPTGAEAAPWDGTWAFITGPTMVWLGDIQVFPESLDQAITIATNDIRFKAERLAAVTYDGCCAFAAKVDLAQNC